MQAQASRGFPLVVEPLRRGSGCITVDFDLAQGREGGQEAVVEEVDDGVFFGTGRTGGRPGEVDELGSSAGVGRRGGGGKLVDERKSVRRPARPEADVRESARRRERPRRGRSREGGGMLEDCRLC